jgi:hypothetical protein
MNSKKNLKGNSVEQVLSEFQKMVNINTKREM